MTDVVDAAQDVSPDVTGAPSGGDGGFDITPFIPLILLGIGGIVVLAATPTIIGVTRELTHEVATQVRPLMVVRRK